MKMTAQRLRELLNYDPTTGIFRWLVSGHGVKAGDVAGYLQSNGYRQIKIDGRKYLASRLAWLYAHGVWPKGQIDHKNGIHNDGRLENFRDVTHAGNMQNQRLAHSNSKTGFLGVSPHLGKFKAQIKLGGKGRYLGLFTTPDEAHAVYLAAKREIHATCTL